MSMPRANEEESAHLTKDYSDSPIHRFRRVRAAPSTLILFALIEFYSLVRAGGRRLQERQEHLPAERCVVRYRVPGGHACGASS